MKNLFFIIGCQRSGTTMLEAILNAHPRVHVVGEEERAAYRYFWKEADLGELPDECVGLRVPAGTHQLDHALAHGEARVLFVLRDPRDVVSSMHRARAGEVPWIAQEAHDEIRRTLENLPNRAELEQRLHQLYGEIEDRGDVRFGAFLWMLKNRYIPLYERSPLPTKIVRYEELVSNPEACLRQICEHLGLEWSDRLLDHGKHNVGEWGGTDKTAPIHRRSVALHKDALTMEDRRKIHSLIQLDMEMHGYVELFD